MTSYRPISCLPDSPCSRCSSVLHSRWEVTASYQCSRLPSGQSYSTQPPTHERTRWDARVCQSDSVSHSELRSQRRVPASISTGSTAEASTFHLIMHLRALANRPGMLKSNIQSRSHVWPRTADRACRMLRQEVPLIWPQNGRTVKQNWTTFQLLKKRDQIKLQKQQTKSMERKTTMGTRNASISKCRLSVSPGNWLTSSKFTNTHQVCGPALSWLLFLIWFIC